MEVRSVMRAARNGFAGSRLANSSKHEDLNNVSGHYHRLGLLLVHLRRRMSACGPARLCWAVGAVNSKVWPISVRTLGLWLPRLAAQARLVSSRFCQRLDRNNFPRLVMRSWF